MTDKRLIIHLGYHKTGSSSIQKWLLDHSNRLDEHLKCYNLADGGSNSLKLAANAWRCGSGTESNLAEQCRALAAEIRTLPQKSICITDESLLGMPLGFAIGDFVEDAIYPFAGRIVSVLAREFAEFSPVFVVFERNSQKWLRSVHNQMHKQGCLTEDFDGYLAKFTPQLDWSALREKLSQSIDKHGRLAVLSFEDEFAHSMVTDMAFFGLLNLPDKMMARCRPVLEQVNPSLPISRGLRSAQPEVMVLGGSNSMIAEGWVNLLRRDYGSLVHVTNLSVGACTSTMGLYRMLTRGQPMPGAAVIWEYGINEFNHMVGGQPLASLLYHLEWVLQICIRENRPFVPLLMRSKAQAVAPHDDGYVRAVMNLFAAYDVIPVDCHRLLRIMMRGDGDFGSWYRDKAHYSTETEFPRRIAEVTILALETARVPTQIADRATHFDPLDLTVHLPSERDGSLKNAVVQCAFSRFENNLEVVVPGRALAAIIVTSGSGPSIRLGAGDTTLGIYATQVGHGPRVPARQLRQLVLGNTCGGLVVPDNRLCIRVDNGNETPMVQTMYTRTSQPETAHANGLVAILGEVPR